MKKRSFFERLSGSVPIADDYDAFEDDFVPQQQPIRKMSSSTMSATPSSPISTMPATRAHNTLDALDEKHSDGELPVDVYQTPSEIVIRTFIAGVRPDEISLSLSRDMVVIEGAREERDAVTDEDYFIRELFWGSFSRTILLPQEVDVDNASAGAKDGLLTIVMPKLDKSRQTKLKVKST
ncbi:MAG: Protein containing Heat shock protein Hsp20 protein [Parcubacteria bacterium C7867-007]|nr:MAG: Protein containing Heat shock protein Hsp20 protein [Parcubacteria bacterium C7867-007]